MTSVCLCFQVHQPFRLRRYRVFDIGDPGYFDDARNEALLRRVANKCYLPANRVLRSLLERHGGRFRVAFSITETALDQFELWAPEVLDSFRDLARTGFVEFLGETGHHSLSFLFDRDEFDAQVASHSERMQREFGQRPRVFRNTELIYHDDLARHVAGLGFHGVLAEGVDEILGWRSPNFVYAANGSPVRLLHRNYRLSDDIGFRFSDPSWNGHPLTAEKFADWIAAINGRGELVDLFLDYETFGEHKWAETGIFAFLEHLPDRVLRHPDNDFTTPGDIIERYEARDVVPHARYTSWADIERDLTAWLGNAMQQTAARELYALRDAVVSAEDPRVHSDWRRLTTSDHVYYMSTKFFADGDVHKYFNPYDSPYEAYINFMNVLNDVARRARTEPVEPLAERERPSRRVAASVRVLPARADVPGIARASD